MEQKKSAVLQLLTLAADAAVCNTKKGKLVD